MRTVETPDRLQFGPKPSSEPKACSYRWTGQPGPQAKPSGRACMTTGAPELDESRPGGAESCIKSVTLIGPKQATINTSIESSQAHLNSARAGQISSVQASSCESAILSQSCTQAKQRNRLETKQPTTDAEGLNESKPDEQQHQSELQPVQPSLAQPSQERQVAIDMISTEGREAGADNLRNNLQQLSRPPRQALDVDRAKRIERLVSVFHLWCSKTEMQSRSRPLPVSGAAQLQPPSQHSEPDSSASTSASASASASASGISSRLAAILSSCQRQSSFTQTPSISADPSQSNASPGLHEPEPGPPEQAEPNLSQAKVWRSLIMPIVLGCTLFLVALWTRQVSLLIVNDTIIMVIILSAVFIVMSGIAFWLANDHQLDDELTRESMDFRAPCWNHQHPNHHHHHHHHHHLNNHRNSQNNNVIDQHNHHGQHLATRQPECSCGLMRSQPNQQTEFGHKCCNGLAVIDCQPPDYYSALRYSLPVSLYRPPDLSIDSAPNSSTVRHIGPDLQHDTSHFDQIQFQLGSSLPPSYDELAAGALG